ncbi:MAG: HAMP domain-containing histidine kinase [bacterium]|nr:HAMP domain-containing histidine kinase [bacterium]MCP5065399.1 HAMP domain-containing histidine kinase [bacterium]
MIRLRLVFILLALGLAVPGFLLVRRALDGVAIEQAARHRAVAERVFDEMERTLSVFLQSEEERPVGHYRHAWSPAGSPPGVLLRSPLADPSPEAFVIGHFEVDLAGVVHTPLRPRSGKTGGSEPVPSPAAEVAAERVLGLARRAWPSRAPSERAAEKQAPGTTVAVGLAAKKDRELRTESDEDSPLADAYDALQSLNRGAALRQKRSQKVVEVAEVLPANEELEGSSWDPGMRALGAPSAAIPGRTADSSIGAEGKGERFKPEAPRPKARAPAERVAAPAPLVIDPIQGFRLDEIHLVLHRTIWRGNQAMRQGLILDTVALETSLLGTALPGLPKVNARLVVPSLEPSPPGGAFSYRHRFAEPFDALAVDLTLPLLAGGSGARTIHGLSFALVLAGSIGLFALYRMVTVAIGFAERRSNFVAAVSHELKTPLTAIRMYGEMLRDDMVPTEEKRHEYYGTITAESERLSRLIDNVLEFSRLQRGSREMSWIVGDLAPVVREARDVLAPHAAAQGFDLEAEISPGLPAVRFDRDAVLQVLFNLVDNALKYAKDAREKKVRIELSPDGDQVVMTVRDHGPGVPPASQKRVFEPFHREESELTRRAQGTGIGLSLVKGLAEQMGASLRAANAPGGGFAVGLVFPTRNDSSPAG